MIKVEVIKKTFIDKITNKEIKYEYLAISGILNGEQFTLEIKPGKEFSKSDLLVAKMLINTQDIQDNELNTIARSANDDEIDAFLDLNNKN